VWARTSSDKSTTPGAGAGTYGAHPRGHAASGAEPEDTQQVARGRTSCPNFLRQKNPRKWRCVSRHTFRDPAAVEAAFAGRWSGFARKDEVVASREQVLEHKRIALELYIAEVGG
jgi:hypothetical protein